MRSSTVLKSILLALAVPALTACDPLRVVGRIGFGENSDCKTSIYGQRMDWAQCHKFKRHFDPNTGDAITINSQVLDSARPLTGTLKLEYWEKAPIIGEIGIPLKRICGTVTVQTDRDGFFNTQINGCGAGKQTMIIGTAFLQATIKKPGSFDQGTIRGTWQDDQAFELFPELIGRRSETPHFTRTDGDISHNYSMPMTGFMIQLGAEPPTSAEHPATINAGMQLVVNRPGADRFGYYRQMLSAFQTMVELQTQFATLTSAAELFRNLYIDEGISGWRKNYMMWFDNTWAYGGRGGISLHRPERASFIERGDGAANRLYILSDVGTVSHEFGHSVNHSNALVIPASSYNFAGGRYSADGVEQGAVHSGGQYEDMGTAMTEGFASGIGQYLLNRCQGWDPTRRLLGGGQDPFSNNQWGMNPRSTGASFAYHMRRQGIAVDSSEWVTRKNRLIALTGHASSHGHRFVMSNSEDRVAEFFCDLLDNDSNTSYFNTRNQSYLPNFTYHVGQILQGQAVGEPAISSYPATVNPPENVRVPLDVLIAAMGTYCENCADWGTLDFGLDFNRRRLSSSGGEGSPQAFMKYLESFASVSHTEAQNVLRANLMETEYEYDF